MVSKPSLVENLQDWISETDQLQRYVAAAVCRDQRRYGPLPFQIGPDDAAQEILVDLMQGHSGRPIAPIRKGRVAAAVRRVLRRYRDRKYQRRSAGLPEIFGLDLEPMGATSPAEVRRLAAELEADLGPTLSDEEARIWHKLTTEGNKTVREIAADLGMRHQRVSEVRRKLEAVITNYLLSRD